MPAKHVYIRDEDLELFDRAQALAGDSLSGVIAEALRRYVEAEEARREGFEEIALEVGYWPPAGAKETKKVKFKGRLLAEGRRFTGQTARRDDRGVTYQIYLTQKGKYVVYWLHWSRWQNEAQTADYAVLARLPSPEEEIQGENSSTTIPGQVLEEAGAKEVIVQIE